MSTVAKTGNRRLDQLEKDIELGIQSVGKALSEIHSTKAYKEQYETFVYLMRHTNGLTKIGRSKKPRAREKTLQAENPRLKMIFHCEADRSVESRLHQIFDSVRVRGKWFDLRPHHVKWIVLVLKGINGSSFNNNNKTS